MYNVLVCDDEKDIVSALKIYLASEGHKVLGLTVGADDYITYVSHFLR